jgi:Flp pilus assembly protein protease CpaA
MQGVLTGGLVMWAAAIAALDLHQRRIPNLLTLPAVLAGLVWMLVSGHCLTGDRWQLGLWAGAFGLAVTLPAYALGKLGAGDAKYLLAIGVLTGWRTTCNTFIIAGAVGLVLVCTWWWVRNNDLARSTLSSLAWLFKPLVTGMGKPPDQLVLPFGTLLSMGLCAELLIRSVK